MQRGGRVGLRQEGAGIQDKKEAGIQNKKEAGIETGRKES